MKASLLTILRDQKTPPEEFRKASNLLGSLLAAESVEHLTEEPKAVQTVFSQVDGKTIRERVVLVPILRSGIALLSPFLKYFPTAPIGFFGIKRDEKTAKPYLYYTNLPTLHPTDRVFLLDPMIATAGSALVAIDHLVSQGVSSSKIVLVGIIGALEGLQKIKTAHPQIKIILAGEDPELNAQKFIVPGLGDFGDRYFLT
jgi:uracil phosphoribosyltransferase